MLLKIVAEYAAGARRRRLGRAREDLPPRGLRGVQGAAAGRCPTCSRSSGRYFPDLIEAFGFANLVKPGYEADDILGTLAEEAKRQGVRLGRRHRRPRRAAGRRRRHLGDERPAAASPTSRSTRRRPVRRALRRHARQGPRLHRPQGRQLRQHPRRSRASARRRPRSCCSSSARIEALYERLDEVKSREAPRAAGRARGRRRASRSGSRRMVCDVPLEARPSRRSSAAAATACRWRASRQFFDRYEFASLRAARCSEIAGAEAAPRGARRRARRAALGEGVGRAGGRCSSTGATAAPPAARGAGRRSPRAGWTRRWRRRPTPAARPPSRAAVGDDQSRRRCGGCAGARRRARRQGAARASRRRRRARPSTPPSPPTCSRRSGRRRSAPCSRSPAPSEGARLVEGPAGRGRARPRAPCSPGASPRRSGRGCSSSVSSGSSARSSCRSCASSRAWRPPASRWTRTGWARSRRACATASTSSRDRIHELAGGPFTIGSPQQLAEVLFTRLGLRARRARARRATRPTPGCCAALRDQHPIVPAVEEWRELTKLLNTYLEPLPAAPRPAHRPPAHHLQPDWSPPPAGSRAPTRTCRTSRCAPSWGREIRACFVAEEGCRLRRRRLLADRAAPHGLALREPALLDAYRRGEDVHRVTAAAVAGIPVEEVTKQQRERAKATNFGIMYGLSAFGLSEQVDIPVEEARAFIDAYFAKYPKVKEFRERVIAQATQDGYVTTLFGRRRAVPGAALVQLPQRARWASAWPSTRSCRARAADIIKVAMVRRRAASSSGAASALAARAAGARRARPRVRRTTRSTACRPLLRDGMCGAFDIDPPLEVDDRRRRRLAGGQVAWRGAAGRRAAPRSRAPCYTPQFRPAAVRGPLPSVNDGPHYVDREATTPHGRQTNRHPARRQRTTPGSSRAAKATSSRSTARSSPTTT